MNPNRRELAHMVFLQRKAEIQILSDTSASKHTGNCLHQDNLRRSGLKPALVKLLEDDIAAGMSAPELEEE